MKQESEAAHQSQCVKWFNEQYCKPSQSPQLRIHSVINGVGISIPKEDKIPVFFQNYFYKLISKFISIQVNLGLYTGVADCLIHGVNGKCLWVEFKKSDGKQSKEQKREQERTEKNGGRYIVPRSLLDFHKQISENIDWLLDK